LFPAIRIPLDGAAGGARHDDPTSPHADAGADGGEQEGEAFLTKGSLERRRHANVVTHADPPREFHVSSRAACVALERLAFGQMEERCHPLEGDPPLHPAMPTLRHRTMDRSRT